MREVGRQYQSYRPAGWYVDPEDDDQYLYWDGHVWTGQRHPIAMKEPQPLWFILTLAAAVVVSLLMVAAMILGA